jgi:NADPH:quinone reductase-like Zn-dependent oxidoreductase
MRAVVYDRYGPPEVLHLADVAAPQPRDDEVLIRVRAATVNRTDCAIRDGTDFVTRFGYSLVTTGSPVKALRRPVQRILGSELAGEVVAVGASASGFAVGDRVFGVNAGKFGAHAELLCMRATAPLAHLPAGMSFAEAAAIPDGALLALGCLRKVDLQPGQRILVYGASGAIGSAGVQLARHMGAVITAVCGTRNLELARQLGAHQVLDYTRDDFTRTGETYDVVFDAVGKRGYRRSASALKPGGRYIPTDGWANLYYAAVTRLRGGKRVMFDIPPHYRQADLVFIKELIEAGAYRAVIDHTYPLEQIVEATRYVETQRKTGSVVLTILDNQGN